MALNKTALKASIKSAFLARLGSVSAEQQEQQQEQEQ
jgi:hypothetical protein